MILCLLSSYQLQISQGLKQKDVIQAENVIFAFSVVKEFIIWFQNRILSGSFHTKFDFIMTCKC